MKYIVRIDDQDYEVEIEDLHARPVVAVIDGEKFEVMPANGGGSPAAQPPAAPRPATAPARPAPVAAPVASVLGGSSVRAPIPGVIQAVLVKPGQQVTKGQELFVIEAMKMKNVVRSHRDGVVAEIAVAPGQTVSHNAVVITFVEG